MSTSTRPDAPVVSVEALAGVLADAVFLRHYDISVRAAGVGECEVCVHFSPALERPGGIVNGVAIMAAADVAFWLAIMTLRGIEEQWVTTDLKTAFLESAKSEDIHTIARILRLGKRKAYGTAECRTPGGTLIAHHVLTYARIGT